MYSTNLSNISPICVISTLYSVKNSTVKNIPRLCHQYAVHCTVYSTYLSKISPVCVICVLCAVYSLQKFATECSTKQLVHGNISVLSNIGAMASSSGRIMNSNTPMEQNRTITTLHSEGSNASKPSWLALWWIFKVKSVYSPVKNIACLCHLYNSLLQLEDVQPRVLVHVEQEPHLTVNNINWWEYSNMFRFIY